jgi:AmiR/NasT family two-component response regulator
MSESEAIEQIFSEDEQLEENVVTKGAKPAEKSPLHNEGEELGGSSKETPDGGPVGKKVAAKMKKAAAPSTHPSQASGKLAEEKDEEEDEDSKEDESEDKKEDKKKEKEMKEYFEVDLSSDVAALTDGENLSEEFKSKAATIFEAAVISRINEQLEVIHEEYAAALTEEVEKVKSELAERVDNYLTYAVTTWMEQNQIAIQNGIKTDIAESVMSGLRQVFVENNIDIADEKVDLVTEMEGQLDTMENKLNEQIEHNVALTKKLGTYIKNGIVSEVCEGLAHSQRDKMISLAEGVEFTSEESFREKMETIKESYFRSDKPVALTEDVQLENTQVNDSMAAYMNAISRWS